MAIPQLFWTPSTQPWHPETCQFHQTDRKALSARLFCPLSLKICFFVADLMIILSTKSNMDFLLAFNFLIFSQVALLIHSFQGAIPRYPKQSRACRCNWFNISCQKKSIVPPCHSAFKASKSVCCIEPLVKSILQFSVVYRVVGSNAIGFERKQIHATKFCSVNRADGPAAGCT